MTEQQTASGEPTVKDVLIVGGGIGGLGTAIALGQRGIRATVVERRDSATGAAIAIQYRPLYALNELGVMEQAEKLGAPLYASEDMKATPVWDGHGVRQAVPFAELDDDWELPMAISIFRPVLSEIMQNAAIEQGQEVLISHSYRSLEQDEDGVEVELTTGQRRRFDLVVGADGINSGLRTRFFSEAGNAIYTGSMSFRTMLPNAPEHWNTGLHSAQGNIVRTTLLPDGQYYIALACHMERRHVDPDEARETVRSVLSMYSGDPLMAEVHDAVTDEIEPIVAPFEWIYVPPPWHRGRVVLVGDAAHATCPTIGSAGGMAVEDALVLAQELVRGADLETALGAYSDRRWERAKLVVETSVDLMKMQQQHGPSAEWAQRRAVVFKKLLEAY